MAGSNEDDGTPPVGPAWDSSGYITNRLKFPVVIDRKKEISFSTFRKIPG